MHTHTVDVPAPSQIVNDGQNTAYRWLLTNQERSYIAGMLDCDVSNVTLTGNTMKRDRSVCKSCHKHSGLDDLVHNALYHNIHTASFMPDILQNGPKKESPAHGILGSSCHTQHEHQWWWAGFW